MNTNEIPLSVIQEYQSTVAFLRKTFDSGMLLPMVTLTALDGRKEVVACPFTNDREKDTFGLLVRRKCHELAAVMATFWSESWHIDNEADHEDYIKHPEIYKYDMGNHPRAKEIVWISIQTPRGYFSGDIPILKGRKLGEASELRKADKMSGRFNFF
jgi:hypothetical protein